MFLLKLLRQSVLVLITLQILSCKKGDIQNDLKVEIYPIQATILNVKEFSCQDFNSITAPSTGSLAGPVFNIYKLVFTWTDKNHNLDIVSLRFVFNSSIFTSGTFDYTLSPEEMSALQPLIFDEFYYCAWCRIRYYDDTNDTTKAISQVTIEDKKNFTYDPDGDGVRDATSTRISCGPRIGGLPIKKDVKTETTVNGYLMVQGLIINKNDPTDITNYYKSFPVRIRYQPPPL